MKAAVRDRILKILEQNKEVQQQSQHFSDDCGISLLQRLFKKQLELISHASQDY